ncbi:MAG: type 4a pilus biogenesis protein PilO [Patescibacteria group bacterium]
MKNMKRWGILLLFVAIFGWFAVIRPQINAFSQKALSVKVKSEEVKSYKQRIADLDAIKAQGDSVTRTLEALFLAMPKSSQIPEVLVMIDALGSRSGVTLDAATVGTPSAGEVPVSLSFTGSLGSVTKFLNAIHNNVRTAIVKNQAITSDDNGQMTVNMQLGLVYQGD